MRDLSVPENMNVNYHNDLNTINIPGLSPQEMNVFYGICGRIKDTGVDSVKLSFEELRTLSGRTRNSPKDFELFLINLNSKLVSISCKIIEEDVERGRVISQFNMFSVFKTYIDNEELEVKLNENFMYLLNELNSNYTTFRFYDFFMLKKGYSKILFRLLSQYKSTGFLKMSVDDFRRLFDVPEGYKMKNINERILAPSITEVEGHFNGLKVEKQSNAGGRTITDLVFKFDKISKSLNDRKPKSSTIEYEGLSATDLEIIKSRY